jgi:hypothetical protein
MTKPARRRIVIVATVLACLAVADLWVRTKKPDLRAYDVAVYERTAVDAQRDDLADIILMGSSRAKYALVPDEFTAVSSKRAHNAAIAGSKVVEWHLLAKRIFSDRRPKLVVLGINASELRADYLPTTAARHLFEFPDLLEHLRRDRPSADVIGNYMRHRLGPAWALFDKRYELKNWCEERLAAVLPKHAQAAKELREWVARPAPPDGFDHPWLRGRQLRTLADRMTTDAAEVFTASTPKFSPRADAFSRLGSLLDWLQSRRIPVLVAYIPNSPATEERWREVEPAMIALIAQACRDRGVPFLACDPDDVPRTNADYVEEIHVGLPLARKISSRAAQYVQAIGLLESNDVRLAGTPEDDAGSP